MEIVMETGLVQISRVPTRPGKPGIEKKNQGNLGNFKILQEVLEKSTILKLLVLIGQQNLSISLINVFQ